MEEEKKTVEALQAENKKLTEQLADLQAELDKERANKAQYCEWWRKKCDEIEAIKTDVASVSVLLKRFEERW